MMNRKNRWNVSALKRNIRRNPWILVVILGLFVLSASCFYADRKISKIDTAGAPTVYLLAPDDPNREVLEASDWEQREIRVEEREDFLLVEVFHRGEPTPFAEGHFRRELSYRSEGMPWEPIRVYDYSNAEAMKNDLGTLFSLLWKGVLVVVILFAGSRLLRKERRRWEVGRETDYIKEYGKKHAERLMQSGLLLVILVFLLLYGLFDLKEMSFFHSWSSRTLYGFLSPLEGTGGGVWERGRPLFTEIHGLGKLFVWNLLLALCLFGGMAGYVRRERKLQKENGGNCDGNSQI